MTSSRLRRRRRDPRARRAGPSLALLALGAVGLALAGCASEDGFRFSQPGEATNVALLGDTAYVSLGASGLGVVDVGSGATRVVEPPPGSGSVDDLAIADGLLFVLDAAEPGHLSILSLADPRTPKLVAGPREVPVGPFSGVSAAAGRVVVSGGTSDLTVHDYDTSSGAFGSLGVGSVDLGQGQPDVLLSADGKRAFVSTHFSGPDFGMTVIDLGSSPPSPPNSVLTVPLDGAGFSPGGAEPANFPIAAARWTDTVIVVAYGGGLATLDPDDPQRKYLSVTQLPVPAVNVAVDPDGTHACVVGGAGTAPTLMFVALDGSEPRVRSVDLPADSRPTGVACDESRAVIAAHRREPLIISRR